MDIKEILNPKGWLIGLGVVVLLLGTMNVFTAEEVAEMGWGEDNVAAHDEAYEQMWGLHMIPYGILAIATGLFVKGKALSQMAMTASGAIVVIVGGGMMWLTNKHEYSNDGTAALVIPLIIMGVTILMGVAGYLHMDDTVEESA
tara:strand:- start:427 stop:858 length:432 start_codon:yes stop_codon:yes gene_type:complete